MKQTETNESNIIKKLLLPMEAFYINEHDYPVKFGQGLLLSRSEWAEIRQKTDRFFDTYTDEEIEECNQKSKEVNREKRYVKQEKTPPKNVFGYVYLVKEVNGRHYKIGRTKNIKSRIKTFGVTLPFRIKLEHEIKCDDYHKAEELLHSQFDEFRVDGEWFKLNPSAVRYIKEIKEFRNGEFVFYKDGEYVN